MGGAREHEWEDVVGHVVVVERDEDLEPLDRPCAVIARRRARLERADVGARLRPGEVHRSRPLTGREPGTLERLLRRDRKCVVSGKSVSVRVDLGGTRLLKNAIATKRTIRTSTREKTQRQHCIDNVVTV